MWTFWQCATAFFATATALFIYLYLDARHDREHEKTLANNLIKEHGELTAWKSEALPILTKYSEAADLACPGAKIGTSKAEALRQFVMLHRRCGRSN